MIDVDWDLAPEGAVAVGQRTDALAFTDKDGHVFLNGHWGISMGWKTIAKRPTFAESITKTPTQTKTVADAVEQEVEKWTHTYNQAEVKCKIIQSKPDFNGCVVVFNDFEEYQLIEPVDLKPIKPTISEAEAWRKVQDGHPAGFIMEKYNVVERD